MAEGEEESMFPGIASSSMRTPGLSDQGYTLETSVSLNYLLKDLISITVTERL